MPTLGVALAVPEPWGGDLQRYRVGVGDLGAGGIPTHVTLVPPVEVAPEDLPGVHEHLAGLAARTSAFEVHLRGTGTFRPVSPVVFVALVEGISQTEALAAACRQGPLAAHLDFPFHPHVTVAHLDDEDALDRAFKEQAGFECQFVADRIHLYMHEPAVGWKPTQSFELVPHDGDEDRT